MAKKIWRLILSRTFAFLILALLQIGFVVVLFWTLAQTGAVAYSIITIFSVLVLLTILEKDSINPAYKVMWLLIIVLMPVTGALFYLLWGHRDVPGRKKASFLHTEAQSRKALSQDPRVMDVLRRADPLRYRDSNYLLLASSAPVYAGTNAEYYPTGEAFFPVFLDALRRAKKFIFLEYFIIEEGVMWNAILDVLRQKAAEGVDVRLLFDGLGCIWTLPRNYPEKMRAYGIQCCPFAPMEPTFHISDYAMLNHRDHRKITCIDGTTAFSGGLNLADEYINLKQPYGEWKDTAYRLDGPAAHSMTISFLSMWAVAAKTDINYLAYQLPPAAPPDAAQLWQQGLVQPYFDTPLDEENVSESAYLNIINHAEQYVYLCTPYLILDHEMISCLSRAARSGVDVRIVTPHIPDKPLVFFLTQSYYPILLEAGVRIFEFVPGFMHAKMYVSDDKTAIVGTANMDYRSLYLHFENCTSFYGGPVVADVHRDLLGCMARGKEITLADVHKTSPFKRILQLAARFFAPML